MLDTAGNARCRSSKGREMLFSTALLIIPDVVIMESNFPTHLSFKYPILDSSSTVGEIRIGTEWTAGSLSPGMCSIVYCHKAPLTRCSDTHGIFFFLLFSFVFPPCVSYHHSFIVHIVKFLGDPSEALAFQGGRDPPGVQSHFFLSALSLLSADAGIFTFASSSLTASLVSSLPCLK